MLMRRSRRVYDEIVSEAGVTVLFHTQVGSVVTENSGHIIIF